MTVLKGIKNTYGDILVAPKYLTSMENDNFEFNFIKENPQFKVVRRIASVPNWIVVEDTTPRAPKKLPSKKEMIDLILEKKLFDFDNYELKKFKQKTKEELANYYADALAR